MEKTGNCQCGAKVRIPNSECLYQCNKCHLRGVFLCHILPESSDPTLLRCKQCKIAYTMFECPQCQGTGVIKDFMPGHPYGCLCGFTAAFLTCNLCTAMLCLPPRGNYQNTPISCKKCGNRFKYRVCTSCKECNYMKQDQQQPPFEKCFNEKCIYFKAYGPQPRSGNRINFGHPAADVPQQQDNLCRICKKKQACMINNSCFHTSACETCVEQLSLDRCPVCSANGQYHRGNFA